MNSAAETMNVRIRRRLRSSGLTEGGVAATFFLVLAITPLFADDYLLYILPQYMLYGVLAMSLSLLWGFTGIVSFGQAALFAIGGYVMGLCMGLNLPVNAGYVGIIAGAGFSGLLAGVIGYFLFSAGVRSTHFVLITLALAIITQQIAVSQSWLTGGWNGMFVSRMSITPGANGAIPGDTGFYLFILFFAAACYFAVRHLLCGRFGRILAGIRENEDRLTAFGYRIEFYKSVAFGLSGVIAGFAGSLYATTSGFVTPSLAGVLFSTQVLVWVAIGGRHSLLGAFAGAMLVVWVSTYFSALIPQYWQLIVGVLFILVIIYFKKGLAGFAESSYHWLRRRVAQ